MRMQICDCIKILNYFDDLAKKVLNFFSPPNDHLIFSSTQIKILQIHYLYNFLSLLPSAQVLGAFDDLNKIADVCERYNLWLHVDACLGGSAIFSRKHKHLLNGKWCIKNRYKYYDDAAEWFCCCFQIINVKFLLHFVCFVNVKLEVIHLWCPWKKWDF